MSGAGAGAGPPPQVSPPPKGEPEDIGWLVIGQICYAVSARRQNNWGWGCSRFCARGPWSPWSSSSYRNVFFLAKNGFSKPIGPKVKKTD